MAIATLMTGLLRLRVNHFLMRTLAAGVFPDKRGSRTSRCVRNAPIWASRALPQSSILAANRRRVGPVQEGSSTRSTGGRGPSVNSG